MALLSSTNKFCFCNRSVRAALAGLLLTPCLMIPVSSAYADDTLDSFALSPEQLFNATVISVSKTPEKVMDAPAAIYVLTDKDIMRSGATSIPEALRLVPGVQVAQVNANNWAISVRGFASTGLGNKLLVLIDGREVYDPLFSGVYWDAQDTVLEDVDRIEVVRGPGGTLWGDNAVDGVINIITKKAGETQGGLTSLAVGNHEKAIGEARYGGRLDDGGAWRVYGKYTDRGPEPAVQGGGTHNSATSGFGTTDHDGWAEGRGGFRTDWDKIGVNNDSLTVQGDTYQSSAGQLRFYPNLTAGTNPLTDEYIDARGSNLLTRWTRNYSSDSRLTVQSYVDYVYRSQEYLDDTRTSFDFDTQYEAPQMAWNKFTVGAHYRYSEDKLGLSPDVTALHARAHDQILNSFIQDKITLDPNRWYLTLGSKFEDNNYTGIEIQPSARLQYHPDDQQMIWGAVSRAVRTPSRLDDDLTLVQAAAKIASTVYTVDTLSNPNLYSEDLVAYELGYRRQLTPTASVDVAAFYNDYSELESYTVSILPFDHVFEGLTPNNSMKGESHGLETTLDWRALNNLRLSASGSLLEMKLWSPNSVGENAENQSPSFQGNLHAEWDITRDVSFDTILYRVDHLQDFGLPGYTRLDMRLGWRIADGLEFDLVGQNLLEPEHPEFLSATNPQTMAAYIGRSVYGKITCRF